MSIFICSDFHFNHSKEFIYQARGFQTIEEMNTEIVKRHNEIVTPDDDVYVLGDLCMSADLAGNKKLIESLNGKLRICRGNHDSDRRWEMYQECKNVVEICGYATMLKYRKYHFYLSHYPCLCSNADDGKTLRECVISLCGHSHIEDPFADWDKGRIFHCEVDTNNCYPWSLDDIIEKMKKKVMEV